MDRHLIPYLQAAIDNHKKKVIDLRVQEYSFTFRQPIEHCDVTVYYDSHSDCVCMNQVFMGPNDHDDADDISIEAFKKYIS